MGDLRTVLLFNPHAGSQRKARQALLEMAASYLRRNGFACVEFVPTTARGSAAQQVMQAVARGAEVIFACGGDGTIHDVLQGVAGTNATLGILPFGSANALGRELGLAQDPVAAARQFRPACSLAIPLSVVRRTDGPERYFLSMAGAGPDGALMYRMMTADRSRWGCWLYYAHALRLFLRRGFLPFQVRFRAADDRWHELACVSVMALRVAALGGVFAGIARGASIHNSEMRVVLVRPPASLSLPLWFLASWLRIPLLNPLVTTVATNALEVDAGGGAYGLAGRWRVARTGACVHPAVSADRACVGPGKSLAVDPSSTSRLTRGHAF